MMNQSTSNTDIIASIETSEDTNLTLTNEMQVEELCDDTIKEKNIYNAVELLNMGEITQRYLIKPIFQQKGTAVLAGKPDLGKSQFARQLCIQVALKSREFLDFEITPVHNKSIYVATEDNIENTRVMLNNQIIGLGEEAKENLRFMFADTMEQGEILKDLDKALTAEPSDLVVVDSFGDIFTGNDANNNMAMRNTVKLFDKIAKKHNCLVLFVHHINKGAYRIAPGQEHIQGGSGLTQKVRLAIVLSEGEGNIRYFTVVKGNYCPKEYKQNSLELLFSEETFLFTNTGNRIATSQIGSQPNNNKNDNKTNELKEAAETILTETPISYGDLVKQYCKITGKSEPTAKRAIKELVTLGMIEKVKDKYQLIMLEKDKIEEVEVSNDIALQGSSIKSIM